MDECKNYLNKETCVIVNVSAEDLSIVEESDEKDFSNILIGKRRVY